MVTTKLFRPLILAGLLGFAAHAQAVDFGKEIVGCSDKGGWPPYSYVDNSAPGKSAGISVDIINKVFTGKINHKIVLIPWKRCLEQVAAGKIDYLFDASDNPDRASKYIYTDIMYKVRHAFYYSTKQFPSGPPNVRDIASINKGIEAKQLKICGVNGYNFGQYKFNTASISDSTKKNSELVKKLKAGRCTLAIGYKEIWEGFAKSGELDLSGLASVQIPESQPLEFYMMISRKFDDNRKLRDLFNDGLYQMRKNGELGKIFANHGLNI